MNPIQSLKCHFDWHTPKRALIHFDGGSYRSRCKGCNQRIRRARKSQWQLVGEQEAEAPLILPR